MLLFAQEVRPGCTELAPACCLKDKASALHELFLCVFSDTHPVGALLKGKRNPETTLGPDDFSDTLLMSAACTWVIHGSLHTRVTIRHNKGTGTKMLDFLLLPTVNQPDQK